MREQVVALRCLAITRQVATSRQMGKCERVTSSPAL